MIFLLDLCFLVFGAQRTGSRLGLEMLQSMRPLQILWHLRGLQYCCLFVSLFLFSEDKSQYSKSNKNTRAALTGVCVFRPWHNIEREPKLWQNKWVSWWWYIKWREQVDHNDNLRKTWSRLGPVSGDQPGEIFLRQKLNCSAPRNKSETLSTSNH